MKIKRYVAKDMRTALAQIKEELGADAVIMSNKKIPEGVELMAAQDNSTPVEPKMGGVSQGANTKRDLADDVVNLSTPAAPTSTLGNHTEMTGAEQPQQRIEPHLSSLNGVAPQEAPSSAESSPADSLSALLARNVQQQPAMSQPSPTAAPVHDAAPDLELQLKQFTDKLQQQQASNESSQNFDLPQVEDDGFDMPVNATPAMHAANTPAAHHSADASVVSMDAFNQMKAEMASIRQLLEHQVSGLMWQDMAQKDPNRAMLIDRLTALGLNDQLADQVAGFVPAHLDEEQSWQSALQLLTSQINTTNNDIIHRGGVVSLVGPTGVGKTTTLAKLAARFAQVHGADSILLISTDTYRIGGFEQLETYGKIIGCPVKLAKDSEALEQLIQQYSSKKLILIDTAGMGQRDMRLAENLSGLVANSRIRIRNYLVLAANTQQAVMQENVERFKKIPLCGCIFTKLDESLSMGEILSTAIQNGLPIGYLTDGQRVPEDIKVANAEKLVSLAEKIANKSAVRFNFSANRQPMASAAFG
ncbi:flagellar biosynthesis protein FlhF [Thalassotalea euphylliae]|uniref:Flagellar biosynthesis protein FlhF n=1 Tax=Thalassotalea euphylliae TaxID=1655234 RepID=A0A3E0TNF0_9GAMM|nr:flagellar biosynthesis protein FlhF [Thalassotalea euphylliae]REL26086.1 flagellar biosynthesis protein FlhF [Thalassotalea euphylliae]